MSLYEIDLDATRRRVDAVAANGLRELGECRQRSEDIDRSVAEMFERQERAKQEMDERVRLAAEQKDEPPAPAARPRPKATLSLGGEEFQQTREAKAEVTVPEARPAQPEPEQRPDQEPRPSRTLRLGVEDQPAQDEPVKPPVRRRPPRQESDDDMSGRTWLR